jgi:NADH-quinone oxidoreductase subunit N
MTELLASLTRFLPELTLTVALVVVVLLDAAGPVWRNAGCRLVTLAALASSLFLAVALPEPGGPAFSGMLALDPLGSFFRVLLLLASLLVVLAFNFRNSRELAGLEQGEFHSLMLAVTLANLLLSASNDLAMLYLSLEMVSVGSYVLVAYMKGDRMSNEASLKYLLFGAVSTGAMLYGLGLLYGLTGTTSLPGIREALAGGLSEQNRFAVYLVSLLVLAGFGFKTALVPFHFWCPDVYQGAPTPVTAFLSVAPKAAGFAILLRFFFGGLAQGAGWELTGAIDWTRLLLVVSAATMTVGNLAALTQTNMKRLLAYSSIAHAGYVLMGVVALSENGARATMIYLLAYLFMNLGAFLVVMLIHQQDGSFDLRDYPGLHRRAPLLTLAMAIFLLSLMGIPPLVGFMAKLYVFAAVIQKAALLESGGRALYVLAVIGALNAAVAAYYYARVLRTMIMDTPEEERPPLRLALADQVWLVFFLAANVLPLLWWGTIEGWARRSLVPFASL